MKNVGKNLTFAVMIRKVESFLGGGSNGAKTTDLVFCGSSRFSVSGYPRTPSKLQRRCIWVFYNIPPNFKPKY